MKDIEYFIRTISNVISRIRKISTAYNPKGQK